MLKSVNENKRFLLVGTLIVLTLLAIPHYVDYCEANKAPNEYCTPYEIIAPLGHFLHRIEGALTALATLAIAWFTLSLRESTDALYDAGEKQRRLSEDTARRQLRAYVGIDGLEFELVGEAFVVLYIKNYAQTPSHDVTSYANVIGVPIVGGGNYAKIPDRFDFADHLPKGIEEERRRVVSKFILQPGQRHGSRVPLTDAESVRNVEAKRTQNTIYVYGHIDYTDIYDRRWRHDFCFQWEPHRPKGQQFLPYERHNRETLIRQASGGDLR